MRIIAGTCKGRRLKAPTWTGLRPTSDKLRETLFNILAPRIEGARVLDLFAGTGAIGLEALSRGAAQRRQPAQLVAPEARNRTPLARNRLHYRAAAGGIHHPALLVADQVVENVSLVVERPAVGLDQAADDRFAKAPRGVDHRSRPIAAEGIGRKQHAGDICVDHLLHHHRKRDAAVGKAGATPVRDRA